MDRKRLSRRQFLRAGAIGVAGAALAACAAPATPQTVEVTRIVESAPKQVEVEVTRVVQGTPEKVVEQVVVTAAVATPEPVTLKIWQHQVSVDGQKGAMIYAKGLYPYINVEYQTSAGPDPTPKLLTSIAANDPDLPDLAWGQNIVPFVTRGGGGLADVKDVMGEHKSEFVKWVLDLATTADGKLLGLPTDTGPMATFYRRSIFKGAGLASDPDGVAKVLGDWDKVLDAAKTIVDKSGGKQWLIEDASTLVDTLRQQAKANYFDDKGEPALNSEGFVKALEYARNFRKAKLDGWGLTGAAVDTGQAMQKNLTGAYLDPAWWDIVINIVAPATAATDKDWGVVPLPTNIAVNSGGSYYLMPEASKHKKEGWLYYSAILMSEPGLDAYMQMGKGRFLPSWKPYYSMKYFNSPDPGYGDQPWLKVFGEIAETVPTMQATVNDSIAVDALGKAITDVLTKDADPKQALDEAVKAVKAQL
jgi:cellobiose transport system substrate-binding protein